MTAYNGAQDARPPTALTLDDLIVSDLALHIGTSRVVADASLTPSQRQLITATGDEYYATPSYQDIKFNGARSLKTGTGGARLLENFQNHTTVLKGSIHDLAKRQAAPSLDKPVADDFTACYEGELVAGSGLSMDDVFAARASRIN